MDNDFLLLLQAKLEEASLKGIKGNLDQLKKEFEELKIKPVLDQQALSDLSVKINKLFTDNKITISNINIDSNQAVKNAQQSGKQIGDAVNKGVENSVKKVTNALKSFSELKIGTGNINAVFNENGLLDVEKSLDRIKEKYSEFGQVKITDKLFDSEGNLQQFRVNIQQLNGDLKESRSFMMALASSGKSFGFPEDIIKGSENYVHHLNDAKKATNEVLTEEEKLANIMADVREKTEQTRQAEEKRQQIAQSNAINKSLEQEYLQRQKISEQLSSKANKIQLSTVNGTYESKVDALVAKTQQWTDVNGNARISTNELSKAFDQLTTASNNYANSPTEAHQKALIASEKELDKQIKTVTNSVRSMNAELAKDSAISSFRNQVTDFMSKNGKTVKSFQFGSELKDIFAKIQQGAKLSNQELAVLKQRFIDVQNAARQTGKLGKTWFQTLREGMSSFSYWTSSTFLVMKAIQEIKKAVNFTRELDSALVNINYTMDVTSSQLANIGNKSIKMAKDLHTTAENVLGAVKLYANAKETADSILAKAQPAIMLSNVTGFSGEQSAKYLQTIMNQFDLTQEDLMNISDTIQGVSQSMAHDFSDGIVQINEGIATSGEVARAAGMDLSEYASMIGMLVEKTGLAGSQLGNSLKTIITRTTKAGKIMGIDEGEISAAETSLRSIGVEVRKTDGEFNAFNDTMSELAKQWDSLSDVEKSNISFNLAGTRQINVIQTLLRNWEEYEELVNKANNSTGVTFENQEKYAASLEGRIKELSATTTSIGENIFKSDDLSVIVSGLTKIAGLFDTITSKTKLLGSIGLGAGIFAGVKNIGKTV